MLIFVIQDLGVILWFSDYCILATLFLDYHLCQKSGQIVPASVISITVRSFSSQACELCAWVKQLSEEEKLQAINHTVSILYYLCLQMRLCYHWYSKVQPILINVFKTYCREWQSHWRFQRQLSRRNHIRFWTYYVPLCQHAL